MSRIPVGCWPVLSNEQLQAILAHTWLDRTPHSARIYLRARCEATRRGWVVVHGVKYSG